MSIARLCLIVFFSWFLTTKAAIGEETRLSFPPLETLYSYHIVESPSQKRISVTELAKALSDKDVIFIGEFHGNHAAHLFQAQLQSKLFQQNANQILSMEQFNRDQQAILNRYLDSDIGEKTLIKEAPAWPNYAASYRPLVEFAKQQFIPVIAANAPADIVRCVGRQGKAYLKKLPSDAMQQLPAEPFYNSPAYQAKFSQFMRHDNPKSPTSKNKPSNGYFAQLLRDNTMAESIQIAHSQNPNHQIIHLNGAFHSNEYLGTVAALKHRNPHIKIAVISPVTVSDPNQPRIEPSDLSLGDYLLFVSPQPADYVQSDKRQAAIKAMFATANKKPCL